MKNLKQSHKLIISAASIIAIFALMVVALKLQGNAFDLESPKVNIAPKQVMETSNSSSDSSQNSYNNPLKGIYVNPFSN